MSSVFIRANEVAAELGVSMPYAYKLIQKMNNELKAKGFLTVSGRVSRQYYHERIYGSQAENEKEDENVSLQG